MSYSILLTRKLAFHQRTNKENDSKYLKRSKLFKEMTMASKTILLFSVLTFSTRTGLAAWGGTESKGTLIEKLTTFQKINRTVFVKSNPFNETQIKAMSVDALISNLKNEYKIVGCSYLAACLTYLKSVSGLLPFSLKHSDDFKKLVPNYYYNPMFQVSSYMVATSVNTADLSFVKDFMWIFNVYAQWLDDRFATAKATEFNVFDEVFLPAHQTLSKLLYQEVQSKKCLQILEDSVDLKWLETMYYSQLIPGDIQSSLLAFRDDYEIPLFDQFMKYERNHLMWREGWQSCYMKKLCLNYIVSEKLTLTNLHEKFGMMKQQVFFNEILESSFDLVCRQRTLDLPETIYELSIFQHNFIQMLKVIMVRLTWFYMSSRSVRKYLYSKKMLKIVNNFIQFFDLHDDSQMKSIVGLFDHQIRKPIASIFNNINPKISTNGTNALINILNDLLQMFVSNSSNYAISFTEDILNNEEKDIAKIKEIVSTNYVVIDEDIRDMPESVYRALVFLKYVKLIFQGINFKIIKDFSKAYNSDTQREFWNLHKGLRQL